MKPISINTPLDIYSVYFPDKENPALCAKIMSNYLGDTSYEPRERVAIPKLEKKVKKQEIE